MSYLVDTNLLLRLAQPKNPHRREAVRSLRALRRQNESLAIIGVTHLLTFNDRDFKRFSEITVINPHSLLDENQS